MNTTEQSTAHVMTAESMNAFVSHAKEQGASENMIRRFSGAVKNLYEYHDELYGHIEECKWLEEFKNGKPRIQYIKVCRDGSRKNKQYVLSEYIRHQIHHPENRENRRFTPEELSQSLAMMRDFIVAKGTST